MLIAGTCAVAVLGGPGPFFEAVASLPPKSLSVPGTTDYWVPGMLFTASAFASLGSMIQPAQWMRFYAARSNGVLKRSALIFALVLTLCFFFGVMLVGLGGRMLYPPRRRKRPVSHERRGEADTQSGRRPNAELL